MKFVIATLTTGLLSTGANAGSAVLVDPNENAVHSWSGAYLGVNAGYAYGISRDKCKHFTYSEFNVTVSLLGENFVGGVQTGYNWRFGSTVFGVETDVQYSPMKIDHNSSTVEMDWAGTTRVRLGFLPEERLLVYATGGIAVGQLEFMVSEYFDLSHDEQRIAKTMTGWAVGAGVDCAIDHNWSLRTEYLFTDFGKLATVDADTERNVASVRFHTVRLDLNYSF